MWMTGSANPKHQNFDVKLNIIYQDNASTIKTEKNGKASSDKRTRHFNIKHRLVTLVGRDEVILISCPTDDMIASNWPAGVCW